MSDSRSQSGQGRLDVNAAAPRANGRRSVEAVGAMLILFGVVSWASEGTSAGPLDAYPGFGHRFETGLRDDTIAFWEAYRREVLVADCMADAGYVYHADAIFPSSSIIMVATDLGWNSETGTGSGPEPSAINAEYYSTLSAGARDGYMQSLYAESAADMAYAMTTELVPAGRESNFAVGGCKGAALQTIGSLWTLPRELAGEIETLRSAMHESDTMVATRSAYETCTEEFGFELDSPAQADELIAVGGSDAEAAVSASAACEDVWLDGYREADANAMATLLQTHASEFSALAARYADVADVIANDEAFIAYLWDAAARANASEQGGSPG